MKRERHHGVRDLGLIIVLVAAAGVLSVLNVAGVVPRSFVLPSYSLIILTVGYLGIRIVATILVRAAEPQIGATRTRGIKNLFEIVVAVIVFVAAVATLGINITGVLVGAGFLGIVLGLAAQQVLGNVFAGLSLVASRPFEIGDRVTLGTGSYGLTGSTYSHESDVNGFTGVVTDVGIFYTDVRLDDGTPAIFPNSVVIGALVINHSRIALRTVQARINLDKRIDFETFKKRFLDSLKDEHVVDVGKSTVEIVDTADTTYQVKLIVWAGTPVVEPVKTMIYQKALELQKQLEPAEERDGQTARSGD
jgi:small conductance mechanosensitive channel